MLFIKRQKQQINHQTLIVLVVASLITFFAILADKLTATSPNVTRVHEISELVQVKDLYSVAVTQATFNNEIGPRIHLPATQRVLVLNLQITNNSEKQLNYLPLIHTFLRNDQADSYTFTPGLTDNTMPAQLIEPGATLKGELAFVVPSDYTPLWFYFDARFNNQGPAAFRIVP
jgi:hypothetical protein